MESNNIFRLNLDGEKDLLPKSENDLRLNDVYDIKFQKNGVCYSFEITNLSCKNPIAGTLTVEATDTKKAQTLGSQIENRIIEEQLPIDSAHLDKVTAKIVEVVKTMNSAHLSAKNEIKNIKGKLLKEGIPAYQLEVERRFSLGLLKQENLIQTSRQLSMF